MKRIHIIGRKNCGKTTLVVELVEYLSAQGYRVGTTKHTHHRHELDVPGKDSHRHREAGAAVVGIVSPGMLAAFVPSDADAQQDKEQPSHPPGRGDDEYARLAPLYTDCDLVLVEGDIHTTAPKVEVWRSVAAESPIAVDDPSVIAVVTDEPLPGSSDDKKTQDETSTSIPVWPRSDLADIAKKILEQLKIAPKN